MNTESPRVCTTVKELRDLYSYPSRIGLIPTMGALHDGHCSLVARSKQENEVTIVSIFTNPTQFDNPDDFAKYPRTLESDIEILRQFEVDYVFAPNVEEMYPDHKRFKVSESETSKLLCGAHRHGHFDGVLTVVLKLLLAVRPARAYFGEKDFQQLTLVRELVEAFFVETQIVGCPTIREQSGLALSSRNARLSESQRETAIAFAQILRDAPSTAAAIAALQELDVRVDYVEERFGRRLAAIRLGPVENEIRLIDNVAV